MSDNNANPVPTKNGKRQFSIHKTPPKKGIITAEMWFIVKPIAVEEPRSSGSAVFCRYVLRPIEKLKNMLSSINNPTTTHTLLINA